MRTFIGPLAAALLLASAGSSLGAGSIGALYGPYTSYGHVVERLDRYDSILKTVKPGERISMWFVPQRSTSHLCYILRSYWRPPRNDLRYGTLLVEFAPNKTRFDSLVIDGYPVAYLDEARRQPVYIDMQKGCRKGDWHVT